MSCRVFGRNIEKIMLLPIIRKALENNLSIRFNLIKNEKNKAVQKFIKEITDKNITIQKQNLYKLEDEYSNLPLEIYGHSDLFN